jgi:nicotinamidase-related amidase
MSAQLFVDTSQPFLHYVDTWHQQLTSLTISQVQPDARRGAILSIDVINGFCSEGTLASPRVARIILPITRLMNAAWQRGTRQIVLIQDTHEPEAVEFNDWAPHCVRGTRESQAVPEIMALPFYSELPIIPKNSINPALNTDLPQWIDQHPDLEDFIVVGDCTDLCTYQLAMFLRLDANARQIQRRVIVPADCVDTYDLPVGTAQQAGIPAHPGEFFNTMFLYHMSLNGIEVVASIGD